MHSNEPNYRADIDGLRAVAVLFVLIFHAFPSLLPGGFTGVDIFFVISGFLISGIVIDGLSDSTFSFLQFYTRRIKRIFPALIVVLVFVFSVSWLILLGEEYKQLGLHIAAGASFVSNFVFWHEAGYFDNAAQTKPLLHLWSLGIEEQFYVIWPLLLAVTWKMRGSFLYMVLGVAFFSFASSTYLVNTDSTAAFYSSLSRFWEIAIGGALAHVVRRRAPPNVQRSNVLSLLGISFILVGAVFITSEKAFPGWWALIPTVGALLVIYAGEKSILSRKLLGNSALRSVGLISYPLYLWHWPLLTFARIVEQENISVFMRLIAIAFSFVLAYITYKYIERPVRFGQRNSSGPLLLCAGMIVIGGVGCYTYYRDGFPSRNEIPEAYALQRKWDYTESEACKTRFPFEKHGWWFCNINTNEAPTILLLGNSHGNHLYPGLISQKEMAHHTILNIGSCDATDGLIYRHDFLRAVNPCRDGFNLKQNSFLRHVVAQNKSIKFAILSSSWLSYDETGKAFSPLDGDPKTWRLESEVPEDQNLPPEQMYANGVSRYIGFLEESGIQVIMAFDTPNVSFDLTRCFIRYGWLSSGSGDAKCGAERSEVNRKQASFRRAAEQLKVQHPAVKFFDPLPYFCDQSFCQIVRDGKLLLRDQHHLSVEGSIFFSEKFLVWAKENRVIF